MCERERECVCERERECRVYPAVEGALAPPIRGARFEVGPVGAVDRDLATCRKETFIELMTSDHKLKASREGSN